MDNRIYLDNAATTKVDDDILNESLRYFVTDYGNPSGVYKESRTSKNALDVSRDSVAELINSRSDEIYFTSSGSESDNWAIRGLTDKSEKKHIITSKVEHKAILSTCEYLESLGYKITYLDVDSCGFVNLKQLEDEITDDTLLVSIMMANNEVGTIQDIKTISEIAHRKGALVHTDAVQALGKIDIDVKDLNVDLMSMSGHKIHAFKGIGAIYIKKGIKISPLIFGGSQESGKRAGTYNVPGIVSLGLACKKLKDNHHERIYIQDLRDYFISEALVKIPDVQLTGDSKQRLINNIHFCFKDVDSNLMTVLLDRAGISCSVGSACMSGSIEKSHVLTAMEVTEDYIAGNIRFSLSKYNTKEEIDTVVHQLVEIVKKVRSK